MKSKLVIFVLGIIVGLLVAYFVPPLIEGWLPEGMTGAKNATTGVVVAKRLEKDRLLLTVESPDGAVLATFKEKVPEIDLLVDKGDEVTLGITSYEPFVDDPKILGVKKAKDMSVGAAGAAQGAAPGAAMGQHEAGEAAESGTAGQPAAAGEGSGSGSGDAAMAPKGPPLEDETQNPASGGDGGGSNQG